LIELSGIERVRLFDVGRVKLLGVRQVKLFIVAPLERNASSRLAKRGFGVDFAGRFFGQNWKDSVTPSHKGTNVYIPLF